MEKRWVIKESGDPGLVKDLAGTLVLTRTWRNC